jgi:hypothetical protein
VAPAAYFAPPGASKAMMPASKATTHHQGPPRSAITCPPAFAKASAWQATSPPTLSHTRTASEFCELSLSLSLVSFFCIPEKVLDMPALPRKNGVSRLHLEVGYCSGWKWKFGEAFHRGGGLEGVA